MGPAEDLPAPRLRFGVARYGRHLLVHGGTCLHNPLDRWRVLILFVPVFMPGYNENDASNELQYYTHRPFQILGIC